MGGRGASSGISNAGKPYGTEYKTVLKHGNIKFVRRNEGAANAPMETMAKGRVYVTVNNQQELKSISYYDKSLKRYKQVDLDHSHYVRGVKTSPHTHKGYYHNEKGDYTLTPKERRMVDRIRSVWHNYLGK